jgi:hypothetical protein
MKAVRLLLPQKSPRWLNLTANLWELIVQHAHRAVDEEGLSNFLDVLGWRIHNKITEEELSVLFYDWISPSAVAQTSNASPNRKDGTYDFKLDIGTFRCLLIDRKCNDPDLDLIIGMSVLELNRILVNVPISFNARKSGMGNGIPALELCSHQWIALSEELFFLLDTKGYGCLRFEEVFFLASCFATGLKGWTDISDAQTDMLTSVLSAIALQTMMESGAKPLLAYSRLLVSAVSPMKRGGYNGEAKGTTKAATKKQSVPSYAREKQRRKKEDNPDTDANNNKKKVKAGKDKALADSQHISASISLPMFKSYLLRKAVNAVALQELVAHIKNSIRDFWEVISVMAKVEQPSMNTFKEVLEVSLAGGNDIGSLGTPQLWEWAVLRASGFKSPSLLSTRNSAAQNIVNGSPGDNSDPPPAVVLFLLSDGEALVSGSLRATEATITSQSIASLRKGLQVSPIKSPSSVHPKSPSAQGMRAQGLQVKPDPREELLLTAEYLWLAYQAWGAIPQPYTFDRLEELKNSLKGGDVEMIETTRDPVYMLIIAVLLEYKLLQKQLVAVLLALASTKFKSEQAIATDPFDSPAAAQAAATMLSDTSSILSLACATLLPDAENMFEELGLNYSNTEDHSNDKKLADHYSSPSRAGQFNARKNSSASANAAGTAGREKISPNTEHIELKKLYTARSRFDGYEGPGDDGNRDDQYLDDDDYGDDFDANLDEFISENNDDLDEVQDAVEDCDESGLSSPPLSPPRHPPPPLSGPTSPEAVPENYRSRSHRLSNLQQQAASAAFPKAMKPDEVLKFQFEAAMSQQASSVAAAAAKNSSPNRMPTSSKPTVSIPPLNIGEKPFVAKDRQETYRNSVTSTISSTLSVNVEQPGSGGTGVTLSNSRSRFAHRLSDASSEEKSNIIVMDTSTNPSKTAAAAAAVVVTTDTVAITKGTGQGRHHRRSIEDREKELLDALLRAKSSVEQQALIDELRKLREMLAPGNGDEEVVDKEQVLTETNSDQAPSLLPIAPSTATGTTSDGTGIVNRARDSRKVGEGTGVDKDALSDVQLAPNSVGLTIGYESAVKFFEYCIVEFCFVTFCMLSVCLYRTRTDR